MPAIIRQIGVPYRGFAPETHDQNRFLTVQLLDFASQRFDFFVRGFDDFDDDRLFGLPVIETCCWVQREIVKLFRRRSDDFLPAHVLGVDTVDFLVCFPHGKQDITAPGVSYVKEFS